MADFFTPTAPLLAAAPWVMVRGNHEVCNRAGQGWYRYLDRPRRRQLRRPTGREDLQRTRRTTIAGNFNDPWAVSFGDTQFVTFDSSNVQKSALSPGRAFQPYTSELAEAAALATPSFFNIWAVHHPVLGYSAANPPTLGSPGLQSVMNAAYPGQLLPAEHRDGHPRSRARLPGVRLLQQSPGDVRGRQRRRQSGLGAAGGRERVQPQRRPARAEHGDQGLRLTRRSSASW